MSLNNKRLFATILIVLCIAVSVNAQSNRDSSGGPPGGFITGGASSVTRLPSLPALNCGVSTVSFQPGARTIWHAHAGGQVIVVTQGTAWYQEKGKPKQILKQGEAIMCPPNVMHWHGATPEAPMIHVVATPNLDKGGVTSGGAVTNEEYKGN